MSHKTEMDTLLAASRDLPLELSLNEVEFLFQNPTIPPAVVQPWWRSGPLKFLLMLTVMICLLGGLLSPLTSENNPVDLSAFPIRETVRAKSSVVALPTTSATPLPTLINLPNPVPRVHPSAFQPSPAPAAAPKRTVARTKSAPPSAIEVPANTSIQQRSSTLMPEALFNGTYSYFKGKLMLTFAYEEDGPVNLLFLELSAEEERLVKKSKREQLVITRAAGSLLLYSTGNKGTFEFLPDTEYRSTMNSRGWGDAATPEGSFIRIIMGKPTEEKWNVEAQKPVQDQDQLWFRYFTHNINNEYVGLLRENGYDDADMEELWKLANAMIGYEKLEELLNLSAAVLTDKPHLGAIAGMKYDLEELRKLKALNVRMTYAEFRRKNVQPKLTSAQTGALAAPLAVNKAVSTSYARNWSLALPGTVSDTIISLPEPAELQLKGNFKIRYSEQPGQKDIIVFGPEKVVRAMNRKSDDPTSLLINPRKKKTIFVEVPPNLKWVLKPSKGITIRNTPKDD